MIEPVRWYVLNGRRVFETQHEYYMRTAKPDWTQWVSWMLNRYYRWRYSRAYRRALRRAA